MLQLHLSDQQFYYLPRCDLYKRLDGSLVNMTLQLNDIIITHDILYLFGTNLISIDNFHVGRSLLWSFMVAYAESPGETTYIAPRTKTVDIIQR